MQAYDLVFERDGDWLWDPDHVGGGGSDSVDGALPGGWSGGHGPSIGDERWPRGSFTGLPMLHVLTIELPEGYRPDDADLVGLALFQGEGQFRSEDDRVVPDASSDDPFLVQLASAEEHPELERYEDEIGGEFAVVRLTREELERGPAAPPADVRRPGEHSGDEDEGPNAWDAAPDDDVVPIRLLAREDPNAGRAPNEDGDGDYEDPFDGDAGDWAAWAQPLFGRNHLGGTSFPAQALPDGLTATYLEIGEIGGMNIGGDGVLQVDLSSDVLDWSAG